MDSIVLKRYLVNIILFSFFIITYTYLPYYQTFDYYAITRNIMYILFFGYLALGLPYHYFAYKSDKKNSFDKTFVVYNFFTTRLPEFIKNRKKGIKSGRPLLDHETKVSFLSLLVKFIFFPMLVVFFFQHLFPFLTSITTSSISDIFSTSNFDTSYNFLLNLIFLFDTGMAAIAYGIESSLLKNNIKSVDTTFLGWIACIACYPQANSITGSLFPLNSSTQIITNMGIVNILKTISLIFGAIFVWSTFSLRFKFSNLCNRGIVSKGSYKYVRHPAYSSKLASWWIENLPFMNLVLAFNLIVWSFIYYLRARTEERHLMKDPEYVAYMKKVKYRFIPYIF